MRTSQSMPVHRLAAVALAVAGLAFVHILVLGPVIGAYGEAVDRLTEARERLARFRDIAASADEIGRQAAEVQERQRASGVFLSGNTDALAGAALQTAIGAMAREAGGSMRSVQSLAAEREDGLVRVRVRVQVVLDTRGLARFLHAIETGRPLLFVDELSLRSRLERSAPRSEELAVSSDFLVDMAISGYRPGDLA